MTQLLVAISLACLISSSDQRKFLLNRLRSHTFETRFKENIAYEDLSQLISAVIKMIAQDTNCLAVITDSHYSPVFGSPFFQHLTNIPVIMVVVRASEDLLAPNYDTVMTVSHAHQASCNLYIILLTNGDQASRLLRFGDKYRVINTRARFIILHSDRLFQPTARHVWDKIINVVFIRAIADSRGYELTTAPFPVQMDDPLTLQPVNLWRAGRFTEKNRLMFPDKTKDLRGEPLFVVTFPHVPSTIRQTVVAQDDDDSSEVITKYTGLEIEILNTLANKMNFRPHLYEAGGDGREKWGHQNTNGSFTGLMGELMAGRAQIALGNLQHSLFSLRLVDLSTPYMSQCFTFITPQSRTDLKWKTLILPFLLNTWTAVLIMLLLGGLLFFLLTNIHRNLRSTATRTIILDQKKKTLPKMLNLGIFPQKKHNEPRNVIVRENPRGGGFYMFGALDNSLLYTYGMLMFVSLPQVPSGWAVRIMLGCWWFFALLMVVSYRASLTAILAKPEPLVTINTIGELAKSDVRCAGWGWLEEAFFTSSFDPDIHRIGLKFEIVEDVNQAMEWVLDGSYSYYENKYLLTYIMAQYEQGPTDNSTVPTGNSTNGAHSLHVMSDCILSTPVSLGLERNSPLKPQVQRMVESGLVDKWLSDVMAETHREAQDQVDLYVQRVVESGLVDKWLSDVMAETHREAQDQVDLYVQRVVESGLVHKWLSDVMAETHRVAQDQVQVDLYVQRMVESGLVHKWLSDVMAETHRVAQDQVQVQAIMDIHKFSGAMLALGVGYLVSILALVGELLYWTLVVRRDPLFDKYDLSKLYFCKKKKTV